MPKNKCTHNHGMIGLSHNVWACDECGKLFEQVSRWKPVSEKEYRRRTDAKQI